MTAENENGDVVVEGKHFVDINLYSDALDEIYALRRALAYEAQVVKAHISFATFPKSRRRHAEEQIERMRSSARGDVHRVYAGTSGLSLRAALEDAGAETGLSRQQWESGR